MPTEAPPAARSDSLSALHLQIDKARFREAVKVSIPTMLGAMAWSSVVGVATIKGGLSIAQSLGMTVVSAGSAQLSALPLLAAHAPAWVIFITALIVNLRFVMFSALLAPHFTYLPWRVRALAGYFSGDMSIALFLQRYPDTMPEPGKLAYFKGLIYANCFAWQFGFLSGIFLGSQVPASWGLDFAGTLSLLCIMLPMTITFAAVAGVLVASGVAVWASHFPYRLGLLVGVLAGICTAMALQEVQNWLRLRRLKATHKMIVQDD